MSTKPCNKLIADQSGLTEGQVGTYLTQVEQQADASWLAYFGNEIEKSPDMLQKLNATKTVLIPAWLAKQWFDRDQAQ
ncbi:hypothetical protein QPL90_04705 [Pseudomonas syringae pv. syringae]|uniref:hypothetical protein n=1 Tax=Pseudomonas syringae TaxID=317 RepID=UPI002E7B3D69|nr:hypothetical protein [Pseudomonas syringae]MEE1990808.1 hypothetical protein [Pseudomonas syringae pv. syringae]MEE1996162.1 hypothetical protein [Pseudomonas syringae pv. syringae]